MTTLPESLLTAEGELLPLRIELEESSGPVSPRYQYQLSIRIETAGGRARLEHRRRGSPSTFSLEAEVSPEELDTLWRSLRATGALEAGGSRLDEPLRRRVGVSFNHCEVRLGDRPPIRLEYLPSLLADDQASGRPDRALLEAIKAFADRLAGA